jgi:hypothetical protein
VTSAGKPGNGSPKPDGARVQAALLSPEICIVVDIRIVPVQAGMKADPLQCVGRQQSCMRNGEYAGHHRGLRAGHVPTGVTWELGRTNCLLARAPEDEVYRLIKRPGVAMLLHLSITASRPRKRC